MEIFEIIKIFSGGASSAGLIVIFVILWKLGVFKKNGNDVNQIGELKKEIVLLKENHIHEISLKLDKLIELEQAGNIEVQKILWHLNNQNK